MIDDDYEKLKREIVFEKVAKAIKEDPSNWIKQVEDLLSELIGYYRIACHHEQNLKTQAPDVSYFRSSRIIWP